MNEYIVRKMHTQISPLGNQIKEEDIRIKAKSYGLDHAGIYSFVDEKDDRVASFHSSSYIIINQSNLAK